MFIGYQRYFPAESIFWRYLEKYWKEWGESLIWERSTGFQSSFSDRDLLMAARKAAPLKICSSGMALLGNREHLIPELELAVDRMHMVLQMADDLGDLEEDLAGNRYNTFLSMMAVNGSLMPSKAKSIDQIGHTIFRTVADGEFIQHMRQISETAHKDLDRLGLSQWGDLISLIVKKTEKQIELHLENIIPPDLNPVFELSK